MKFFVPYSSEESPAEHVWQATRDFLAAQGLATNERRISKLAFTRGGEHHVIKVGGRYPDLHEDVLIILQAADAPTYYVCTPNRGVVRGAPLLIGNTNGRVLAVEFRE